MSIWTRIKNFFLDDRSIKEEFRAMIEADEIQKRVEVVKSTAAAVEKEIETAVDNIEAQITTTTTNVTNQITDAVTQIKPKRARKAKNVNTAKKAPVKK